jgi:hypothetical protein
MKHGSRMLAQPKSNYYNKLREMAFSILCSPRSAASLPTSSAPQWARSISQQAAKGRYRMVEMKMPDKISAVKLDAQLAGELIEKPQQINVGFQLINQRLETLDLPRSPD